MVRIKKFNNNPTHGEREEVIIDCDRFNQLRIDKNLSLKDVATMSGVPYSVISKISAGYAQTQEQIPYSVLQKY